MSIAVSVENISKYYRLGIISSKTLSADISRWWAHRRGQPDPFLKIGEQDYSDREDEYIWALRDISFQVEQGEALGIIGRNGAGKSTLLKILSRVTAPTSGQIKARGRIASLLEVGTGFHPELTGRENIYLNGTILGMNRAKISRKFDEIVDFSGVEKYIDTPVKRYSSGMYVRLAFAVAAYLEPEILVVDEVLAVGDTEFQKKCLGKMGDVAHQGRTVLFVSHNMGAITQLCTTALLIEQGKLKKSGNADDIVREYLSSNDIKKHEIQLADYPLRNGTNEVKFQWAKLQNFNQEGSKYFSLGDDIYILFEIQANDTYINKKIRLAVEVRNSLGVRICNMIDRDSDFQIKYLQDKQTISVCIKDVRFYPDTYYISLWAGSITSSEILDNVIDCLSFEIVDGGKLTTRRLPTSAGIIFMTPQWKLYDKEEL